MSKTLTVRRDGNVIDLSLDGQQGLPGSVRRIVEPVLCYQHKRFLHGMERYQEDGSIRKVQTVTKQLFGYDERGRLGTNAGFLSRIASTMRKEGYRLELLDYTPAERRPNHPRFTPVMEAVTSRFSYKPRQEECLRAILENACGQVHAVTGFGKMALIVMTALALQKPTIDITAKRVDIVKNMVRYLRKYMPCGQVGDGKCDTGHRVTVYTADSLHKSPGTADILLADEAHELVTDKFASQLRRYRYSRNYGFTASPEGRFDGAGIRLEALFGRPIFTLTYPEAVELGLVVPLEVEWCDVICPTNPCLRARNDVDRKRYGIWQNDYRNATIAAKVRSFGDAQTLVLVETVEHAVYLYQHLPEAELVYGSLEDTVLRKYQRNGLLPADFRVMDRKMRQLAKEKFERGETRLAIATGVWAVGVDFTQLQNLVRADAGGSEIASIQMPGRVSRIDQSGKKKVGVVVDLHDNFDQSFEQKARSRFRHYAKMGWTQFTRNPVFT